MLHQHKIAQAMSRNKAQHSNHLMREINMHHFIKDLPPKKYNPNRKLRKKAIKRRSITQDQSNPFQQHFQQIAKIQRSGTIKYSKNFDQIKDKNDVYKRGWSGFQQRVDVKARTSLKEAREKAKTIQQRMASSTVWTKGGVAVGPKGPKNKTMPPHPIGKEKIKDLWHLMKGTDPEQKVFRMRDLASDVDKSVVLNNAYAICQRSEPHSPPKKQKFESFVYLRQNEDRLPTQTYHSLLRDNFLQP